MPSNIAEGHARFRSKDNHRFLLIARASLKETEEHLVDGLESDYFTSAEFAATHLLVKRITSGMSKHMQYLRSPEAEANWRKIETRSQERNKRR